MPVEVHYYNEWSRYKKRPLKVWTEEQAQQAHTQHKLYTVVVGQSEAPDCFIEVHLGNQYIGVFFLDDHRRNCSSYLFKVQDGQLFLHEYLQRSFDGNSDTVTGSTRYFYTPEGTVVKQVVDVGTNTTNQQEIGTNVDVASNWEPIPSFGQYTGVIQKNRNIFTK